MQFKNCLIYSNTIYNSKGTAIRFADQNNRKDFLFYNNIFIAADSLLKGKRAADIFLANNWWSLKSKFNIEGITDLGKWVKNSGQEMIEGKLVGSNINPGFNFQYTSSITSPSALKLFKPYKLRASSPLRQQGLDLHNLYGIETGGIDFNGQPAPVKGIGACY
jgi:hypothetical protein